jgi:GNAT superfamily N-acetyltransferase
MPTDPNTAEIAVLVADAWQARGIARRLLVELADLAQARQIRCRVGDTLRVPLDSRLPQDSSIHGHGLEAGGLG